MRNCDPKGMKTGNVLIFLEIVWLENSKNSPKIYNFLTRAILNHPFYKVGTNHSSDASTLLYTKKKSMVL